MPNNDVLGLIALRYFPYSFLSFTSELIKITNPSKLARLDYNINFSGIPLPCKNLQEDSKTCLYFWGERKKVL